MIQADLLSQYSEGYRFVIITQSMRIDGYLREYNGYEPNWGTGVFPINADGTVGQYIRGNWDSSD